MIVRRSGGGGSAPKGQRIGGPYPSVHGATAGGWTLHDLNGVVQSVVAAANGVQVALKNPGAFGVPGLGATWCKPALYDSTGNLLVGGIEPEDGMFRTHLYERSISFAVNPSQVRVLYGWGNHPTDPLLATSGILWGIEYLSTNLRTVTIVVCVAGVWSVLLNGTGQAAHFGTEGSFTGRSASTIWARTATPLDATGLYATIGSNIVNNTGAVICEKLTTQYLFAGWQAVGGTVGDSITFDAQAWIHPMNGRG